MPLTPNGKFLLNGVSIDVAIHFEINAGVCTLCLTSSALAITTSTYGACVTINDAARATPNFFCSRLSNSDAVNEYATDRDLGVGPDSGGIGTQWTIGDYTFVLSRGDYRAITPRPPCLNAYGVQVIDTNPIKDKCCNCTCICHGMCLTKRSITGSTSYTALLDDNNQWVFGSGAIVDLYSTAYDRTCYLRLYPDEGVVPSDVAINSVSNPCPRPSATWDVSVAATAYYAAHTAHYELSCLNCKSECGVEIAGNCCSRTNFPRVLYADVTTTCPDCLTMTISLVWDSLFSTWSGEGIMCGHPFTLSIACPFTTLSFSGSPCTSATPSATGTPTCNPILASFAFSSGGIGCCGGSSVVNPDITVTVYE